MKSRTWNILVIGMTVLALLMVSGITIYIDPFFHYHAPLKQYQYPLNDERYQNDGIARHFEYDAIIAGSSMTENFRKSQFDELFGTDCVKIPLEGGSYKEINDLLIRAMKEHPDVKIVLRSLDYSSLICNKDDVLEMGGVRPKYLYDDNIWNDVEYLLNKKVLLSKTYEVIRYTHVGGVMPTFDQYAYWSSDYEYGKEYVEDAFNRDEEYDEEPHPFTEKERLTTKENLEQNVIQLAKDYPDTTFYVFFTPYSIGYWNMWDCRGTVERILDAEKFAIEMLLEYPNIKLYSFTDNFALVTDFDNYKDMAHFGGWVNAQILTWMKEGTGLLTKDNYEAYCKRVRDFYTTFSYDTLYQ